MQKLNELSLVKMAPDSLSSDEEIKRILTVIDIAINKRLVDKIKEVDLDRIDDLEEWKIDHLAVENHIDFYDDKLTLPEKRELVKYSIINHMQKGTAYAAQIAAEKASDAAKSGYGVRTVDVFVKGVGLGRDAAIRAVSGFDIAVNSIKDVTGVPHGGVRPRKARRV